MTLSRSTLIFTARVFSLAMVETRSTPAEKLFGIELQQLVVAGRDHPVVIGEGAVDQLAGEDRAAEAEADLGRRQRDLDRSLELLEQPVELVHGFARNDHVGHALGAVGPRHGDPGEAVAVGRGRAQLIVDDVEEDAHQIITRLLARDGEAGLLDDLAQRRGGELEPGRQLALGDHREIVARQGRKIEARAAGDDLHLAFGRGDLDLAAFGQLADDVEEGVRGNRGRAGLRDVGRERSRRPGGRGRSPSAGSSRRRAPRSARWTGSGWCCGAPRPIGRGRGSSGGRPLNRRFHRFKPLIRTRHGTVIASRSAAEVG